MALPPATGEGRPSSFVTERSACGVSVSLSLPVLLLPSVSVAPPAIVAVASLTTVPVAAASTLAFHVIVTFLFGARLPTHVPVVCVPTVKAPTFGVPQGLAVGVSVAGGFSVRVKDVTVLGPSLRIVIV